MSFVERYDSLQYMIIAWVKNYFTIEKDAKENWNVLLAL